MSMNAYQKISAACLISMLVGAFIGFAVFSRFVPKPIEYVRGTVDVTPLEDEVMRNQMLIAQMRGLKAPSWVPINIDETKDQGRLVLWRLDSIRQGRDDIRYFVEQTRPGEDTPR